MEKWWADAFVYHVFPLGYCGGPKTNDFSSPPEPRINALLKLPERLADLGCNTILLGPVFESTSHGYDTVDLWHIDRRLGSDDDMKRVIGELHRKGFKVVFDGVFHHVGRDFWAFWELRRDGENSNRKNWFSGIDFGSAGRHGDGFVYDNWEGHDSLVKLNTGDPEVREYVFGAVGKMIGYFGIDGLRLDVAYALDMDFLRGLCGYCRSLKEDFWIMGEVIHGPYDTWLEDGLLDSVTNYECYKSNWSSLNDDNYFEIDWSLLRHFEEVNGGDTVRMYNFADNHDVMRAASRIKDPNKLALLYAMLCFMPGIPSIYYGSELGAEGDRGKSDDWDLRPNAEILNYGDRALFDYISGLIRIRKAFPALNRGSFKRLYVANKQYAFERRESGNNSPPVIAAFNMAETASRVDIKMPGTEAWKIIETGGWKPGGGASAAERSGDTVTLSVGPESWLLAGPKE